VSGDPNVSSPPRCLSFAGYEWVVKAAARFDPGPNAWSDATSNVFVDARGLHLSITNVNGQWYASEVVLNRALGFGRYVFRTASNFDGLDRRVVVGLFSYAYADTIAGHREIDIEFSPLLGLAPGADTHFTIQPFTVHGHTHDFIRERGQTAAIHSFEWRADQIVFQSGSEQWTYTGADIPAPAQANVRMNAWLFEGLPPADLRTQEVVISGFEYTP